jgi:DNA-binding CsgD family transcriptional regulator
MAQEFATLTQRLTGPVFSTSYGGKATSYSFNVGTSFGNPSEPGNEAATLERMQRTDLPPGLSGLDLQSWLDALGALPVAPLTENDILAWVEGPLRKFFPFERFFGAYGNLSGGLIRLRRSPVTSGYTQEFLASLESVFDVNLRGCFAWWVSNRRAFFVDATGGRDEHGVPIAATRRELEEMERFAMGNVAAHGVIDPYVDAGTYISFAGVPTTRPEQTLAAALDLIAPVLHSLLLATKRREEAGVDLTALTDRQREMVDLAVEGLSDKAIARRLSISDHTVGNHFRAIYAQLGISKRSHLIALLK